MHGISAKGVVSNLAGNLATRAHALNRFIKCASVKISFHKRPLPAELIALSSIEGKKLFREALDSGGMESYFPLAEQFITQSDPSFCSISSLAMVMNALNFDLKRIWKGSWRWVTEEMLQCNSQAVCGHSISKVQQSGLSFSEFESLARCHGVKISPHRVCSPTPGECQDHSYERFRELVREVSGNASASSFLVTNFSRKYLGQTGDGHYSPIGGYHQGRDMVLVLDVARFKYPPYWVRLGDLWASMAASDKATGQTRGYFLISVWEKQISSLDRGNSSREEEMRASCPSVIKSWVDFDPRPSSPILCSHTNAPGHDHNHGHRQVHTAS
jgi:glutathione gamma-glutamylcysteinyltransferase